MQVRKIKKYCENVISSPMHKQLSTFYDDNLVSKATNK